MLYVTIKSIIMSLIILSVIMLNVIMLNFIMLNVIMLNVMAPFRQAYNQPHKIEIFLNFSFRGRISAKLIYFVLVQ